MHLDGEGAQTREQRREEMNERIVATALRVLSQEGFEAITIQRLAGELGCAVGALYRYFKSKDALLVAVLHRIMDRLGKDLQAADRHVCKRSDLDEKDRALLRVMMAGEVYVQSSMRHAEEFGLVSTLIGDPRELLATEDAAPLLPPMMRMMGELTRYFSSAQELGALDDGGKASARGVTYWAALQGILQLRKLGRFGASALHWDELAPGLILSLLIGWGGDHQRVKILSGEVEGVWKAMNAESSSEFDPESSSERLPSASQ